MAPTKKKSPPLPPRPDPKAERSKGRVSKTERRLSHPDVIVPADGVPLGVHGFIVNIEKMLLRSRRTLDKEFFLLDEITKERNTGRYHGIMAIAAKRPRAEQNINASQLYVVKVSIRSAQERVKFTRERNTLQKLSRASGVGRNHIIDLISSDPHEEQASWLAMPLARGPTLNTVLQDRKGPYPPILAYTFFQQMCTVLNWLHNVSEGKPYHLFHGDLNAGNIIFDISHYPPESPHSVMPQASLARYLPNIKILDFGFAMEREDTAKTFLPEVALGSGNVPLNVREVSHDFSVEDVYYLGLHVHYIVTNGRQRTKSDGHLAKAVDPPEYWNWQVGIRQHSKPKTHKHASRTEERAKFPQEPQLAIEELWYEHGRLPLNRLAKLAYNDVLAIWSCCMQGAGARPDASKVDAMWRGALQTERGQTSPNTIRRQIDMYEANDRRLSREEREHMEKRKQRMAENARRDAQTMKARLHAAKEAQERVQTKPAKVVSRVQIDVMKQEVQDLQRREQQLKREILDSQDTIRKKRARGAYVEADKAMMEVGDLEKELGKLVLDINKLLSGKQKSGEVGQKAGGVQGAAGRVQKPKVQRSRSNGGGGGAVRGQQRRPRTRSSDKENKFKRDRKDRVP